MATNDSFQEQNPIQNFVFKVIKGVVIRLLLIIIMPIAMGIGIPKLANYVNFPLPKWFMPLLIIATIIIAIVVLVRYIIKQYFLLKQGFQNMEQIMEQSMSQPPIEYGVIQNNPMYYQGNGQQYFQGYNANGQQMYNAQQASAAGYTNAYATPGSQPASSGKQGCSKAFGILVLTLVLAVNELIFGGMYLANQKIEDEYTLVDATVTNVERYTELTKDNDGDDIEVTRYRITFDYDIDGKTYSVEKDDLRNPQNVNDIVPIYVSPNDPKLITLPLEEPLKEVLMIVSIVIPIIWLLGSIGIARSKR